MLLTALVLVSTIAVPVAREGTGALPIEESSQPPIDTTESEADGEDGEEALYTLVDGPAGISDFGQSIANLGDFTGDGIDDLILSGRQGVMDGSGDLVWPTNYLLPGNSSGTLLSSNLIEIKNLSSRWWFPDERWLGDVNGDGIADFVSDWLDYRDQTIQNPFWSEIIQVRHGGKDPDRYMPDYYIEAKRPSSEPWGWNGYEFSGVGDVNGDGYDDLCVFSHSMSTSEHYYPAELRLYYGSEDGLSRTPSWNASYSLQEYIWWNCLGQIDHGDVDGDGFSDVIFRQYNTSRTEFIRVHYGSEAGISKHADINGSISDYMDTIRTHSPADLNGDGYDDIFMGAQFAPYSSLPYNSVFFTGRPTGESLNSTYRFWFRNDSIQSFALTDINGDGLDDVFCFHTPWSTSGAVIGDLTVDVYLNRNGSLAQLPDLSFTVENVANMGWLLLALTVGGDFDGDGRGDAAIGLPGSADDDHGRVMVVWGKGIMDRLRPLELEEGPVLYAGLGPYDFKVTASLVGRPTLPVAVRITLDPGGANVTLRCGLLAGGTHFAVEWDPEGLVELHSGPLDVVHDERNGTVLHYRVVPGWGWPHEEVCDVLVEHEWQDGTRSSIPTASVFSVENDLTMVGSVTASGEWQGEVAESGWVRAGENVTLSGPRVVYEGTVDLYPPDGACVVTVTDDDGDTAEGQMTPGEPVSVTIAADAATDTEETLRLGLADLLGTAESRANITFTLGVDGDAPAFLDPVPDDVDWQSTNDVLVSITATDVPTSGVDASSLEYSYSVEGPSGFGSWTTASLSTTVVGPEVEGLVTVSLPDGTNNIIRWRALDLVGNVGESGQFVIRVDTRNVSFTDPFPPAGVWQTSTEVECGVTIHDNEGSGIQVSTIQYRVSPRNLSQYSEWLDWDEGSLVDAQTVTTRTDVSLAEAPYNYVQWRAFDIAGNGFTASPHYRIPADATPVTFTDFLPEGMQRGPDVTCWVSVSDQELGSGVNLSSVEYRYRPSGGEYTSWTSVGMVGESMSNRFSMVLSLPDGEDNLVQYRGLDVAGNGPSESSEYRIATDSTPPVVLVVSPDLEARFLVTSVVIALSISDEGIGMEASGAWYRYGPSGEASLGDWVAIAGTLEGKALTAEVTIDLVPGPGNSLQFRATDMLGNEGTTDVQALWVNRAPVAVIESPMDGELFYATDLIPLNASGSHDPDDDALTITWTVEFDDGTYHPVEGDLLLEEGSYRVHLAVVDEYGAEDTAVVGIEVERVEPKPPREEPIPTWLILLLVLVAVLAVGGAAYLYRRRRLDM